MQAVLEYLRFKMCTSKQLTDEAKTDHPGGVQHNHGLQLPFPIAIEKAQDAHLWTWTETVISIFCRRAVPTMLGSNYAPLREKVFELLRFADP
jgi:glutamate-1-semialdehyde aminotransferase